MTDPNLLIPFHFVATVAKDFLAVVAAVYQFEYEVFMPTKLHKGHMQVIEQLDF